MVRISLKQAKAWGIVIPDEKAIPKAKLPKKPKREPQALVGPPQTWHVTLPEFKVPSLNVLLSLPWYRRKKLKQGVYGFVAHYGKHVLPAVGKRRVFITIIRTGRAKEMDADNCKKILLDALVKCGILGDDKPAWVECPDPIQLRGGGNETHLEIEEL